DRNRQDNPDIAADDQDRQPQRQAIDQADVRQRQDHERGHEQQLVGSRIQPLTQRGLLTSGARREAVEQIGQPGDREDRQRAAEFAVQRQDDEHRYQQHPKQRQLVRDGEHLGRHYRARASDRKSTRLNSSHGYISYAV